MAGILCDLLGFDAKRALGAGRKEDVGDVFGIPDTVIQIANWQDALRAIREKPIEAATQAGNAGANFSTAAVRLRGGVWRFVQTPEQYCDLWREAQPL